jgi:lysyl-tRNA synthetase class II
MKKLVLKLIVTAMAVVMLCTNLSGCGLLFLNYDKTASTEDTKLTQTEEDAEPAKTEPKPTYSVINIEEVGAEWDKNPYNAKELYVGKYVEITGRLFFIGSSGSLITLETENDTWDLTTAHCLLTTQKQKDHLRNLVIDDIVTVRGKITSVYGSFGLEVHEFVE